MAESSLLDDLFINYDCDLVRTPKRKKKKKRMMPELEEKYKKHEQ